MCLLTFNQQAHSATTSLNLESPCYLGYPERRTEYEVFDEYVEDGNVAKVQPVISDWLNQRGWGERYAQWQRSLRCDSPFAKSNYYGDSAYCRQLLKPSGLAIDLESPLDSKAMCSSKAASMAYLTMHKYLLQSMRALWPDLENHFSPWMMLPQQEDFPSNMQPLFKAWPDKVQRDAMLLGSMSKMSDRELFQRWPSQRDFVHWMLCGSDKPGIAIDSLYGVLTSNMMQSVDPSSEYKNIELDQYLFWKAHAWLEMQWNRYRMRLDLMPVEPELQADIIAQCEVFESFAKPSRNPKNANTQPIPPFFENGKFNARNIGKRFRVLGKVLDILDLNDGQKFFRIELPLLGTESVWVSTYFPLLQGEISTGGHYNFIGYLTLTNQLDTSGYLTKKLNAELVLMASSIQSPK